MKRQTLFFIFSFILHASVFYMMTVDFGSSGEQIILNYGDEFASGNPSVKMKIARRKVVPTTVEKKTPVKKGKAKSSAEASEVATNTPPEIKKDIVEQKEQSDGLDDGGPLGGTDEFDSFSQGSSELGVRTPLALYMKNLRDIIERNKFYPPIARRLRQEGVVKIRITINKEGKIEEAQVVEGKYPALKDAALKIVTERSTFPGFLKEIKQERMKITIPINFEII